MNDFLKTLLIWILIAVVLLAVFNSFTSSSGSKTQAIAYSTFLTDVQEGGITSVTFDGRDI
ncbi:MAG: ATP-dependent metallopeptidase FtsH/Yme1/Tma family protein, partial [Gammaproteobacteria bacterium]